MYSVQVNSKCRAIEQPVSTQSLLTFPTKPNPSSVNLIQKEQNILVPNFKKVYFENTFTLKDITYEIKGRH